MLARSPSCATGPQAVPVISWFHSPLYRCVLVPHRPNNCLRVVEMGGTDDLCGIL